ncbi:uncharacterized protein LOC143041027 [Oratosquilla oratoria]|uniref:uncharacterized protein LOC143041027 n=1 Tax=Oratosquilla oratoria TaxID=337810 RepID=UPI003F763E38
MSAKRKPPTPPSPKLDSEDEDIFAGRRVSVSEFDGQDFGYESVSSPGASSTSSEPVYVRQPGFDHHAHEIRVPPPHGTTPKAHGASSPSPSTSSSLTVPTPTSGHITPTSSSAGSKGSKKKKSSSHDLRGEVKKESTGTPSPTSSRAKVKKEPLPMKLRALPQSFWMQPNKANLLPPSNSVLPPLVLGKDPSDVIDVQPVTPPAEDIGDKDHSRLERDKCERILKVGNTDLLFSLFDSVEQSEKKKVMVVKRGRPRKPPATVLPRVLRDDDPCLFNAGTESLLPLLPDRTPVSSGSSTPLGIRQGQGQQVLEMVNLRDGDRTISLPSLNVEHNYNQILSELVLKL